LHSQQLLMDGLAALSERAEISKHQDGPLLKDVLESTSEKANRSVFKRVADARQQLVELQQLVGDCLQAWLLFMHAAVLTAL
jgi:hypothetical protein